MLKRYFWVFFLPTIAGAQINTTTWGVNDTSVCLIKSYEFIMPHGYIQMNNNSGADLPMRWIKQIDPNWPVGWETGFTDPDSAYADVLIEDSADFVLPFPDDFNDKLILNVDHNFVIDTSYIRFKVFPIDHPQDSLWLNFCVIIHAPDLSITNLNNELQVHVDVLNQTLSLDTPIQHAQVNIYDPGGKVVFSASDFSDNQIDISGLNTGLYFIRFESDHTAFTRKFFRY